MKTHEVEVTQAHIDMGESQPSCCPIALAVLDSFLFEEIGLDSDQAGVYVHSDYLAIDNKKNLNSKNELPFSEDEVAISIALGGAGTDTFQIFALDNKVSNWVEAFDDIGSKKEDRPNRDVKPITLRFSKHDGVGKVHKV